VLNLPTLQSADNQRIKATVALRRHRQRRATGLFVAEGFRQVTRALDAGLAQHHGFVCPALVGALNDDQVDSLLRRCTAQPGAAPWFSVDERLMRKMAYRQNPSGILAVFERPDWTFEALERRLATADVPEAFSGTDLWLIAVGMTKPGNIGAMARSAEAAGAWGMFVADAEVDPVNPNAIRASTGAVFHLPLVCGGSDEILAFLRRRDAQIIAASPRAEACYTTFDLTGPTALVIGAEDRGLTPPWVEDDGAVVCAAVPMSGHAVDSLNAAAVAAVLLFEAVRQRGVS